MESAMDLGSMLDIIKALGLPAIIFTVWWFDHRKLTAMIAVIQKDADFIREVKDAILLVLTSQSRIEQKVDTNQFCPAVRQAEGKEPK